MSASAEGGIRFGQYVLLRRIARGGMAEVFLAQQRGLEGFDRRVAVKRILPHLADAPDFVKMFLKEAQLAAQLTHPNVVHIYDFGKHDGDYFIAMEFVDGVHTGQLFKYGEKELLPPTMVARIGADAATALHYAHELRNPAGTPLGVVHRDVSPANIMVSFDGVVKLCDFGIAKAAALGDQLTNPGQVKGKYAYMSPEQTIAAPLDGRSDVFSLGIVLWELLAGKTIVGRGDAVEAMRAIRDGKLPPIQQAAPRTPPALAKAITWALQTRREIRATAMDFAQALEAFIKSSPEIATPMQLGSWVRKRFARVHTGQHAAIPGVSVGTKLIPGSVMSPDALDAPSTAVVDGTQLGTVTPASQLIAASQIRSEDEVLDTAETVLVGGEHANDATVIQPPGAADHESTQRDGATVIVDEPVDETLLRSGAYRPQIAGGPAALPTMVEPARLERRKTPIPAPADATAGIPRRGPRLAVAIGGLVLLAVTSFLIALATRPGAAPAASDAGSERVAPAADATALAVTTLATPMDAAVGAPADGREPTIRPDAADPDPARPDPARSDPTEELTLLEVRTKPGGGTVKIGGELRRDPAKFALLPGRYAIVAEHDGYRAERREVVLLKGVDLVQEIAFTRKLAGARPGPQPGRLTVRTTPYSVVFHNRRRLGETPFADLELPAGSYTLTFKNPARRTVTRQVTITAGQLTKLGFELPQL